MILQIKCVIRLTIIGASKREIRSDKNIYYNASDLKAIKDHFASLSLSS